MISENKVKSQEKDRQVGYNKWKMRIQMITFIVASMAVMVIHCCILF